MIIIIGNDFFGNKIADSIKENSNKFARYFDTSNSFLDKLLYIFYLPFAESVYSISGSIKKGGALSLALMMRKKISQHFIGSDVTEAISDFKKGNYSEKLISNSYFYCEVSWIKKEVELNLPISCEILDLPVLHNVSFKTVSNSTNKNRVLAYIGKGREEFYGIEHILYAARHLPYLDFVLIGSDCLKYRDRATSNILFQGWVENPLEVMKSCNVLVRHTEHDGLPFSIVEALSLGLYVVYNREFSSCLLAKNGNEIVKHLVDVFSLDENHFFNKTGSVEVSSRYCSKLVTSRILGKII